jgi:tetratricopeptide (TPR) repeat protein
VDRIYAYHYDCQRSEYSAQAHVQTAEVHNPYGFRNPFHVLHLLLKGDSINIHLQPYPIGEIMKKVMLIASFVFAVNLFGQTAQEYMQSATNKHSKQEFAEAIKDYDQVIKIEKNNENAYFNRGTCYLALKKLEQALEDLNKAIELDPTFTKAYYNRASVYIMQKKYAESLPDLDKIIGLDISFPNVLTLRGQIRAQIGNKEDACKDFRKAKEIGDKNADEYLNRFCGNEQLSGESLMLYWPENENWKIGNTQDNEKMSLLELIHTNETLEEWTEFGSMMSLKGATGLDIDTAMNIMFEQSRKNAPESKLTFIEKDESAEYPWILFTIESPRFKNDSRPESQLWYIIQGKTSLYVNFRAVRQAKISTELKEKWSKFFKAGKILYK